MFNGDISLKFVLEDYFFPINKKFILTYNFSTNKFVKDGENVDLTLKMNLTKFSSLIMVSLSFNSAIEHGLIEADNLTYIDCVDKLFRTKNKPVGFNEF